MQNSGGVLQRTWVENYEFHAYFLLILGNFQPGFLENIGILGKLAEFWNHKNVCFFLHLQEVSECQLFYHLQSSRSVQYNNYGINWIRLHSSPVEISLGLISASFLPSSESYHLWDHGGSDVFISKACKALPKVRSWHTLSLSRSPSHSVCQLNSKGLYWHGKCVY